MWVIRFDYLDEFLLGIAKFGEKGFYKVEDLVDDLVFYRSKLFNFQLLILQIKNPIHSLHIRSLIKLSCTLFKEEAPRRLIPSSIVPN